MIILTSITLTQAQSFLDSIPALPPPSGIIVNVATAAELNQAIIDAQDGQTILVADGTYEMKPYVPLNINAPNVTVRGASDDATKAIIRGNGFKDSLKIDLFRIYSHSTVLAYITIEDVRSYGMMLRTGNNDNMLLHGCRFIDCNKRCLKAPGYVTGPTEPVPESHNGIIRYCLFEQKTPISLDIPNLDLPGDVGNYVAGMDMMRLEGWQIHHNVFLNFKGITGGGRAAIFMWGGAQGGCRNIIIEDNVFVGNDRSIALGNPSGIFDAESIVVRNNFINAGFDYGLELCFCKDVKVYNNTFYTSNPTRRMVHAYQIMTGNILKNNIIVGPFVCEIGTLPDTTGNISVQSNISSWFEDPVNGDFHLKATATQAINTGVALPEVLDDFDNLPRDASPDMGADEYGNETTQVAELPQGSRDQMVLQAYPNPFNASTRIEFSNQAQTIRGNIQIMDMVGRVVDHMTIPGSRSAVAVIEWNAQTRPSGIYIIKMHTENRVFTKHIVLIR